ncbi:hypothetical protein [Frankia sp. AgB32]|uniref:hypothetical protein n=1 Tax=Frankia sp. AgB32 TaxID=631119 RepID=UPI00200F0627|nr:hypothetical protein [Frankia sp. AgB32]MCK9893912.1 hypothetical protein [Frankia sp. AgB32]
MKKGMGRGAAVLAMSSAASVVLTLGPSLAAAHAFDDKGDGINNKDNCVGNRDDKDDKDDKDSKDSKDNWDLFGDKNKDDKGQVKDDKDQVKDDKQAHSDDINKDNNDDWFNWDDKDKNKDKDKDNRNCPVGVVAGVGVGVVGGGMADPASSPMIPLAGAAFGALLIGAGVARRRAQGAA